jgi:hypothetical protein
VKNGWRWRRDTLGTIARRLVNDLYSRAMRPFDFRSDGELNIAWICKCLMSLVLTSLTSQYRSSHYLCRVCHSLTLPSSLRIVRVQAHPVVPMVMSSLRAFIPTADHTHAMASRVVTHAPLALIWSRNMMRPPIRAGFPMTLQCRPTVIICTDQLLY